MRKLVWLMIISLMLVSCQTGTTDNINTPLEEAQTNDQTNEDINPVEETQEDVSEVDPIETTDVEPEEIVEPEEVVEVIDYELLYQTHHVNEVGKVIVIMYHNLSDKVGAYATTPELFKADLERLYNEDYRTVSMSDLVNNTIDIPIGTTPVVLTFDDGSKSNFYYDEAGDIASDCVVGILDEFYAEHEDFGRNAVFYLYGENPFRERDLLEKKLTYLVENGYEIGSHSFGHEKLKHLDALGLQKSLGRNEAFIESMVPDYDLVHLSLPYGQRPQEVYMDYLWQGSYEETTYEIISAVNVGWNPVVSPANIDFNPKSINRITCGDDEMELNYWLDYFVDHPEKRFYSDGDASTVVVPESKLETVDDKYKEMTITYKESEEE